MARTPQTNSTTSLTPKLFVALELSKNTWKLGITLSRVGKPRIFDVDARDLDGFLAEIEAAKTRYGLGPDAPVKTCYEAGRDGFWIHRFLEANGIENVIVDSASIEVDRRKRRAKTDRIDAQKLAILLARHHDGEAVFRVVAVPPLESECERLLPRQLRSIRRSRTRISNQIRALLFQHGIDLDPRGGSFKGKSFLKALAQARQWDGSRLPAELSAQVRLLWKQFALFTQQLKQLEQRQREVIREARRDASRATVAQQKAACLSLLRGIGDTGSYTLATEFFGWREFRNRGQVGALAGLTGTPYQSGEGGRDQGISKAGNPRVRTLMVELAWLWLRFQPESALTKWFHEHTGKAGSRSRRKAIVAVARKLLIQLWHFVEHGVVPEGAVLQKAA
jgi:transposase